MKLPDERKELIKKISRKVMADIKRNRPDLLADRPKQRAQNQMTLGSLIKALTRERVGLLVKTDENCPGMPHSYYGYPSDLAFEPSTTPITVAQFLAVCEGAIRASFIGPDHSEDYHKEALTEDYYRDYIMQPNTPVWISELDTASKIGIVDVVPTNGYILLVTETIEEEE